MDDDNVHYFENKRIRTVWDEEKQEWYLSVSDAVEALTDSADVKQYIKKMRNRDPELDSRWGTICTPTEMIAADGKKYLTTAASIDGILRIIQSVPSQKTEQFKSWLESINSGIALPSAENKGEIILYQPDDNSIKLDVLLENETVWLNRQQIAVLFDRDVKTIGKHINNALNEELSGLTSVAKFATHLPDGRIFNIDYFDLDVILSVGYRVKSKRGIQFRRWTNGVMKDYIMKGYAVNQRFERLEYRVADTEKKIDLFVKTSMPPLQGALYKGQIFEAHKIASDLIRSAKESIILLDNYVDNSVLLLLSERSPGVSAEIYTRHISPQLKLGIDKHNAQFDPVCVHRSDKFHDRFLIIDHVVYHIGASLKDLGTELFAFSKMEISDRWILDKI